MRKYMCGIFIAISIAVLCFVVVVVCNYNTRVDNTIHMQSTNQEDHELVLANAQKIYSVMTEYGLAHQNIAGIISNFVLESRKDSMYWFDIDARLSYMSTSSNDDRQVWLSTWVPLSTPEDAASEFSEYWDCNTKSIEDECRREAASWFVLIQDWDADVDYSSSIIGAVGQAQRGVVCN